MEGRTSGEGKWWRGEQVARERGGGENKWRGKGMAGRTSGELKRVEGRTSCEGKGWRGEQVAKQRVGVEKAARERSGEENKWRGKGMEGGTSGELKRVEGRTRCEGKGWRGEQVAS